MDFYKQFEELGKKRSVKEAQEVEKITRKEESRLLPYKSTSKKGTGEYYATLQDKINVIIINKFSYQLLNHLAKNPTLPEADREYITENLRYFKD